MWVQCQIINCTLEVGDIVGLAMGMDKLDVLDKAKKDSDVMTQFGNDILEGHSLCIMNVYE